MLENTLSNPEALGSDIPGEALFFAERLLPSMKWYAVSVRSRHEKLVTRHLEHQGLNHFLPVYRSVRRWKDRRQELDMALFPGYVFVNLNLRDRLRVLRAPGAVQFVTFQGQPAAIPDSEIRALESSLSAGLRLQPHPYLHQGARVRLKRGPLVGAEGIMIRRKERFRLVLSIDLIMRSVVFEVDEADVEPI
ncbi:MAG TPA: UpxY family transcription antiterminator [Terriglobales bacterium]|nr:UpxY family transcription antiterminator [Terriglobales bacterium]